MRQRDKKNNETKRQKVGKERESEREMERERERE